MLRVLTAVGGVVLGVAVPIVSNVNFQNVVSTGTVLIGVMVAVGTILAMSYGVKWKPTAQAAIARASELDKELEAEKLRHEQCSAERKMAFEKIAELEKINARLESLPNLALVLEQMSKEAQRIDAHAKERLTLALDTVHTSFREHTDTVVQAIHDLGSELKAK